MDSSQSLLEMAVERASDAGFATRGLKADLGKPETARALAASAGGPRLWMVLGNSLGVIDPQNFLKTLRALLRPEDRLLVDGEVFNAHETLAGYDNLVNRKFAFAPLASLGLEEGRDGELVFEIETPASLDGVHVVTKYFRAARSIEVPLAGQRIKLEAGEKILMNGSYKYSRDAFHKLIAETAGFEILKEYLSEDSSFLMALVGLPHPQSAPAVSPGATRRGPR